MRRSGPKPGRLNVSNIIRDFAWALQTDQLPEGTSTIQFNVQIDNQTVVKYILVREDSPQVCDENMGYDVDVNIAAELKTLGLIWFNSLSIPAAKKQGLLKVFGNSFYVKNINRWLGTSTFKANKNLKAGNAYCP